MRKCVGPLLFWIMDSYWACEIFLARYLYIININVFFSFYKLENTKLNLQELTLHRSSDNDHRDERL